MVKKALEILDSKNWARRVTTLAGIIAIIYAILGGVNFVYDVFNPKPSEFTIDDINRLSELVEPGIEIKDSQISGSAICQGTGASCIVTENVSANLPEGSLPMEMFFNGQVIYNLAPQMVKLKNVLFIKNDIGKKIFIQKSFPFDENIHYGNCNEEFTHCIVFDKFVFDQEKMKDSVCSIINSDSKNNCAYSIDLEDVPTNECLVKGNGIFKINFLKNESQTQFDARCLAK